MQCSNILNSTRCFFVSNVGSWYCLEMVCFIVISIMIIFIYFFFLTNSYSLLLPFFFCLISGNKWIHLKVHS
jgi:hypothetical protein